MAKEYEVSYYAWNGEHGHTGRHSYLKDALDEAKQLYSREKKEGALKEYGYIGVEGADDFAIVYVTQEYLDRVMRKDAFKEESAYENWMGVAKEVLKTGKPKKGNYSGVSKIEEGGGVDSGEEYSVGGILLGAGLGIAGIIGYQKIKNDNPDARGAASVSSREEELKMWQNKLEDKWDELRKTTLPTKIRFYDDGQDIESRVYEIFHKGKWRPSSHGEFQELFTLPTERGGDEPMYNRKKKSEGGKFVWYLDNKKMEHGGEVQSTGDDIFWLITG